MWTKIRKKLLEMLADSLKGKVDFKMTAYRYGWRSIGKNHQMPTITILYNGEIVLRTYYCVKHLEGTPYQRHKSFDTEEFYNTLREYLSLKHNVSRYNDNKYFRLFTLLDRRTGKRTLKTLIDDYYGCNDIELKRIYEMRLIEEHIDVKRQE